MKITMETNYGYPTLEVDGGPVEDPAHRGMLIGGVTVDLCGPQEKALEVAALLTVSPELLQFISDNLARFYSTGVTRRDFELGLELVERARGGK